METDYPPAPSRKPGLRHTVFVQLDPTGRHEIGLSFINKSLISIILLAVAIAVLETEAELNTTYGFAFSILNLSFFSIFALEYAARFWCCVERENGLSPLHNRLAFLRSPWSIFDLAILGISAAPLLGSNLLVFRLLRILRIISLAQLGRTSTALTHLSEAIRSRAYELLLTMALSAALILFGATALYWIEGHLPDGKFASIPRALWWSVVTFTTIGYGDVSPATPLGKTVAGLVAIAAIGLVAMPTGILAAAFTEAMQKHRAPGQRANGVPNQTPDQHTDEVPRS